MGQENRTAVFVNTQSDGDHPHEISELCVSLKITMEMSDACGTLEAEILDSPYINMRFGDEILVVIDNTAFFGGKLFTMKRGAGDEYTRTYTFYDYSRYLKCDVSYAMPYPATLSEAFKILCEKMDVPVGRVDDSRWLCNPQSFRKTTSNEILEKLRDETLVNTNRAFAWRHNAGKLELIDIEDWNPLDITGNILPNIIEFDTEESIDKNTYNDIEFVQKKKSTSSQKKGTIKHKPSPKPKISGGTVTNNQASSSVMSGMSDQYTGMSAQKAQTSKLVQQLDMPKLEVMGGLSSKQLGSSKPKSEKVGDDIGSTHVTTSVLEIAEFGRLKKVIEVDEQVPTSTINNYIQILRNPTREMSFKMICDKVLFRPGMRCFIGEADNASIYLVNSVTTDIRNDGIFQDVETARWQDEFVKSSAGAKDEAIARKKVFDTFYTRYLEDMRKKVGQDLTERYKRELAKVDTDKIIEADDWGMSNKPYHRDANNNIRYTSELDRGKKLIKG